jgi:hypothetical protein
VAPWGCRRGTASTWCRSTCSAGPPTRPDHYGLPAPAGGLFQNHPTISDTILHRLTHGEVRPRPGIERLDGDEVVFEDGSRDRVDVIVWATGYRVTIPFLDEQWLGDDPEQLPLYQRVFHLDDPSLAFVGLMQSTGAALPVLETQAKLVAAHLAGTYALPSPQDQRRSVERALRAATARWGAHHRPMMRIDFDAYCAQVPRELKAGQARLRRGAGRAFTPTEHQEVQA